MKKTIFILLVFSLFSSLQAYSKKIIFSSFSKEERAKKSLDNYMKTDSYKKLYALSLEHEFKIYTRASGKYYIVVVEPLLSKDVGTLAYDLVKKEYKSAYVNRYEAPKKEVKLEKKEAVKKIVENKQEEKQKIEPLLVKTPQKTQEPVVQTKVKEITEELHEEVEKPQVFKEKTKEFTVDVLDILLYLVIAFILIVIIYYLRKFKRIYDEY